jgi:hypothetical protein
MQPDERQQLLDEEHLRLLRIAYLIHGATYAVCAVFPLIYVAIGMIFMTVPIKHGNGPDPRFLGVVFAAIGIFAALAVGTYGGLQLYAARCLRLRRSRTLCLFAAVITCLSIPLGTALGVFTFIVLGRPTVQNIFSSGAPTTQGTPSPAASAGFSSAPPLA